MNKEIILSYFKHSLAEIEVRKNLEKGLLFFLQSSIEAKSLVPTKVGQKTTTAKPRNGVKRVERLLNNKFFTREFMRDAYLHGIKRLIPQGKDATLAVDWTIIRNKYCLLSVSWILDAGRSIPLYFTGYVKEELDDGDSQSAIEMRAIRDVLGSLSHAGNITIVADRGFDSPRLLEYLHLSGVQYVVRSKAKRYITLKNGEKLKLTHELIKKGEKRKYSQVFYTSINPVKLSVYMKWDKAQDEPWILLSNMETSIEQSASLYASRWEIEEMFKSLKNQDVGFDLKAVKLRHLDRWLRLLFLSTYLFQFLGQLGIAARRISKIEREFSLSSRPPKKQKYIYSIYTLAMLILEYSRIDLEYFMGMFLFKMYDTQWVALL